MGVIRNQRSKIISRPKMMSTARRLFKNISIFKRRKIKHLYVVCKIHLLARAPTRHSAARPSARDDRVSFIQNVWLYVYISLTVDSIVRLIYTVCNTNCVYARYLSSRTRRSRIVYIQIHGVYSCETVLFLI